MRGDEDGIVIVENATAGEEKVFERAHASRAVRGVDDRERKLRRERVCAHRGHLALDALDGATRPLAALVATRRDVRQHVHHRDVVPPPHARCDITQI